MSSTAASMVVEATAAATAASTTHVTYSQFITESVRYFATSANDLIDRKYGTQQLAKDFALLVAQIRSIDLAIVVALLLVLTAARHYATRLIFEPIIQWRGIGANEAGKIPESAWKLTFYLTTWLTAAYLIFGDESAQYFRYPERVWQNYSINNPVEGGIYLLYAIELSFYLHSLYTTIVLDQRRKDTLTLMFHHIVCVLLITISYCNKSHKSGLLCLFLHDGSDVLLEATKLIRYFKVQHGRTYEVEIFVNAGFACFLLTWITNRLYWFPIKQVYIASVYLESQSISVPFISFLVGLLWIILLMNYYWFSFALRLLYRVISGQLDELEDNREYKENNGDPKQLDCDSVHTTDEDFRKFSVDSGVIVSNHRDAEDTETEKSSTAADEDFDINQSSKPSDDDDYDENEEEEEENDEDNETRSDDQASNGTRNYNLRQRKIDFSVFR